ncbi:NfeD family protein [Lacimicrobium sp. SS2-24]|uniref:NfeD family protein n=1 Tax=Lacimicrobium sp. SS2-24 TaxID=2005569 RepID=UPI000B4B46C7|nr:NfeD family protein [Lacimicrobium sp. SS2-24]
MTLFTDHLAETLIVIGLILLAVEILVLGFSTFVLFFVGLAALITGGLMYISLVPATLFGAIGSLAVLTAMLAAVLWRPMKKIQAKTEPKEVTSDLIGYRFYLPQALNPGDSLTYRYSGVNWTVRTREPLMAKQEVEVTKVSVGELEVRAAIGE